MSFSRLVVLADTTIYPALPYFPVTFDGKIRNRSKPFCQKKSITALDKSFLPFYYSIEFLRWSFYYSILLPKKEIRKLLQRTTNDPARLFCWLHPMFPTAIKRNQLTMFYD
jgi:hypothetical protein